MSAIRIRGIGRYYFAMFYKDSPRHQKGSDLLTGLDTLHGNMYQTVPAHPSVARDDLVPPGNAAITGPAHPSAAIVETTSIPAFAISVRLACCTAGVCEEVQSARTIVR